MLHLLQQPCRTHSLVAGQQGGERDGCRDGGGESIRRVQSVCQTAVFGTVHYGSLRRVEGLV